MCVPGQLPGFAGTSEALAAAKASLSYLAGTQAALLPAGELADCLRELEAVESVHTTARAAVLAAFTAQAGCQDDGHGSARAWLIGQTRVTEAAAGASVAWMRRLEAHPLVREALTGQLIPSSVARELCKLSRKLPADLQQDADRILLDAWSGGATLADLVGLVEEMLRRCAPPDRDHDRGFTDRGVQLDATFGGAGKLVGDLTPECTATMSAYLEATSKKAGPEDERTLAQRCHDALEDAFRRLISAGDLPDVAGQPTQVVMHMTMGQLRDRDGAAEVELAWLAGRAAGEGQPGWASSWQAAEAYSCDAVITSLVTGYVDSAVVATATRAFLAESRLAESRLAGQTGCPAHGCDCPADRPGTEPGPDGLPANAIIGGPEFGSGWEPRGASPRPAGGAGSDGRPAPTMARLQDTLLRYATDMLSGPVGLAAALRTKLDGPQAVGVSLPLDIGAPTRTVPPHLRRAVIARDRRCVFPGCRQKPSACQVHHLIPRSRGGPTALRNLALVCAFHHLTVIHRWGWTLRLHGDGTTTAISPDRQRTLHSHGPPATVA